MSCLKLSVALVLVGALVASAAPAPRDVYTLVNGYPVLINLAAHADYNDEGSLKHLDFTTDGVKVNSANGRDFKTMKVVKSVGDVEFGVTLSSKKVELLFIDEVSIHFNKTGHSCKLQSIDKIESLNKVEIRAGQYECVGESGPFKVHLDAFKFEILDSSTRAADVRILVNGYPALVNLAAQVDYQEEGVSKHLTFKPEGITVTNVNGHDFKTKKVVKSVGDVEFGVILSTKDVELLIIDEVSIHFNKTGHSCKLQPLDKIESLNRVEIRAGHYECVEESSPIKVNLDSFRFEILDPTTA